MGWVINNNASHVLGTRKPKVFWLNEFNDHTLRAFHATVTDCFSENQGILPIYIESDGGRVDIMNGVISIMDYGRKLGMKFATSVNGRAMSAGAVVFLFGDENLRYMGTNSKLLLHSGRMGIIGKPGEVKLAADQYEEECKVLDAKLSKHLKKPKNWLQSNLKKRKDYDWVLTPEQAAAEKLCEIHTPTFLITVAETLTVS